MDASQYLLPQRRNRVYGTADLDQGQDLDVFQSKMQQTLSTLTSDKTFPFEDVFDESLPKIAVPNSLQKRVNQAIEQCASLNKSSTNAFIDTSTSSGRPPEMAINKTTCIRPSHPIYSIRLGRFVTVAEMFKCQGLWKDDFAAPNAIDEELKNTSDAQDLCGNAFASTCAQAQLIASLVHAKGWQSIGGINVEETECDHEGQSDSSERFGTGSAEKSGRSSSRDTITTEETRQSPTTSVKRRVDHAEEDQEQVSNAKKPKRSSVAKTSDEDCLGVL